jgi:tRNA nucleotidyltransferase (CCA-adding enzyme)
MDLEDILRQNYPDDNLTRCLSGIVSSMGEILKNSSSFLKVKKITPAGSLGRNTILKGHKEVDCVYILEYNGYSFNHSFWEVQRVLRDNLPQVSHFDIKKHSISFMLERPIGTISVDLLPAFEINHPNQIMQVKNREAYYGSTSLLQKKYFKNVIQHYSRFTDLVRLLKVWRNTLEIPLTSYMLELIASNAVYDTKPDQEFPFFLEVCFRTIQSFTDGREIVPVYWEKYVDNSELNFGYSQNDLWIIDPSDPSENLTRNFSVDEKEYMRSEATKGAIKIQKGEYGFLV